MSAKEHTTVAVRNTPHDGFAVVANAKEHPLRIAEYGDDLVVTDPEQLRQLDMKTKLGILNDPKLFNRLPKNAQVLLGKLTDLADHEHQTLAVIPANDPRAGWTRESRVPRAVSEREREDLSLQLGLDQTGEASWEEINTSLQMKTMLETLRPASQRATANADLVEEQLREAADAPRRDLADMGDLVDEVGALYLGHRTAAGAAALEAAMNLQLMPPAPSDEGPSVFKGLNPAAKKMFSGICVGEFVEKLSGMFGKPRLITTKKYRCGGDCKRCLSTPGDVLPDPQNKCPCEYFRGLGGVTDVIPVTLCESCEYCSEHSRTLISPCAYAEMAKTTVSTCVSTDCKIHPQPPKDTIQEVSDIPEETTETSKPVKISKALKALKALKKSKKSEDFVFPKMPPQRPPRYTCIIKPWHRRWLHMNPV